jgi:hypothetical protein
MAKKATTKAAEARTETDQYFEGMEPPKIAELDKLIAANEEAKAQVEAAKEELEMAEGRLVKAMYKHLESLDRDAKGNARYLSKAIQKVATLTVDEPKEKVKIKSAPRAKSPAVE